MPRKLPSRRTMRTSPNSAGKTIDNAGTSRLTLVNAVLGILAAIIAIVAAVYSFLPTQPDKDKQNGIVVTVVDDTSPVGLEATASCAQRAGEAWKQWMQREGISPQEVTVEMYTLYMLNLAEDLAKCSPNETRFTFRLPEKQIAVTAHEVHPIVLRAYVWCRDFTFSETLDAGGEDTEHGSLCKGVDGFFDWN